MKFVIIFGVELRCAPGPSKHHLRPEHGEADVGRFKCNYGRTIKPEHLLIASMISEKKKT